MEQHKVIWQEGMFISPHHFQQQERYLEHRSGQLQQLLSPGCWGLHECVLDYELLKVGKLCVRSARGLFPDGTPFTLENSIIRDVDTNASGKLYYLALPLYRQGTRESSGEEDSLQRRYRRHSQELFDSHSDNSDAVAMDLGQLDIRLRWDGEELDEYSLIPVARISECRPDGDVVIDSHYLPPLLTVGASRFLTDQLSDLYAQFRRRTQDLAQRLQMQAGERSAQLLQNEYLLLQAMNRCCAELGILHQAPWMAPFDLYRALVGMAGELATFSHTLTPEFPAWNASAIYPCFAAVLAELRGGLSHSRDETVHPLPWDDSLFQKRRLLRTSVSDRTLFNDARFILVVQSSLGSLKCRELFPVAAKLCGHNRIAERVRGALSAVTLQSLPVPPVELKAHPNAAYFEVDCRHPLWRELVEQNDMLALHVDEQMPGDIQIDLYAIR